ncbi:MAG: hypothetical protein IKB20_03685 [Clostridia bacterium]|nr:hypothetical protein [Clostridia bacterium]
MKKRSIERQLKKEIESASPSDFSAVFARCEKSTVAQTEEVLVGAGGEEVRSPRRKTKLTALILAGFLFLSLAVGFLIGGIRGAFDSKLKFSQGYFLLDINPSVEVAYNEEGIVTSAVGLNDDGKALLVGLALTDKSYQEAADMLFERCYAMGYFARGREDNAMLVTALSEDGEKDKAMTDAIRSALANSFIKNKLCGVVITGVSDPALEENAKNYGINAQKYGLILSYLALGGALEEERYASVSVRELYALIDGKEQELKAAKIAENELILNKFERELHETLSEQIEGLLDTMGVYLSDEKTAQQEKLEALQENAAALENVQTQTERKQLIDEIILQLEGLKAGETDAQVLAMIDNAKISVSVLYNFFEKAFILLKKESATPEQICKIRLWKFASYGDGAEDVGFEEWQALYEESVAKRWYEMKEAWRKARKQDF